MVKNCKNFRTRSESTLQHSIFDRKRQIYLLKDVIRCTYTFRIPWITIYQRTLDIVISEACIFLQGSHIRSVFFDVFLELCEFSVEEYISESSIFVTTTKNHENSVRATLENIVLPNHRFGVWFSSDGHENCISVKNIAICNQNMFWYALWMVISTCSSSSSS